MKRPLRIAYAAVNGGRKYRTAALRDENGRYRDLIATVTAAADANLDVLVFPAGYFQVSADRARAALRRRLRLGLQAAAPHLAVVVGIDRVSGAPAAKSMAAKAAPTGHPYFAVHRTGSGKIVPMQQVSVTCDEGVRDVVDARWGTRSLLLPETKLAFLLCGESWSDHLLDRVVASKPRALVVAAHRSVSMQKGDGGWAKLSWHHRLQAFADQHSIPIVLAEHTRSPDRHPYSWPAGISRELVLDGVPDDVTLRLATIRA